MTVPSGLSLNGYGGSLTFDAPSAWLITGQEPGPEPYWAKSSREWWLRKVTVARFENFAELDVPSRMLLHGANPNAGPDGEYRADLESQHGLELRNVADFDVRGVEVVDVWGDGIYLLDSAGVLDKPVVNGTSRQGITVARTRLTKPVTISDARIRNVRRSAFDLEPFGSTRENRIERVRIIGGTASSYRLGWLSAGSAHEVSDVYVAGHTADVIKVRCGTDDGLPRHSWTLEDCTGTQPWSGPVDAPGCMEFHKVDGLTLRNVTQPIKWAGPKRSKVAVSLIGCRNVTVQNCDFPLLDRNDNVIGQAEIVEAP